MTTDRHDGDNGDALDDPAMAGLLTALHDVARGPAPAIGSDLAAILGGAVPLASTRPGRSRTTTAVVIGLVSTGMLAGGISAAAANELPAPVQRVVAKVVSTITPFEIPHPDRHAPPAHVPDDAPTSPVPSEPDDATSPPTVSPPAPVSTGENDRADDRGQQGGGTRLDDDDAADDPSSPADEGTSGEEGEGREPRTGDAEGRGEGRSSGEGEGEGESDRGDGGSDSRDGQD